MKCIGWGSSEASRIKIIYSFAWNNPLPHKISISTYDSDDPLPHPISISTFASNDPLPYHFAANARIPAAAAKRSRDCFALLVKYLYIPWGNVINEMLFEHVRPPLDNVKQGLFEWPWVHSEPHIKHSCTLHRKSLVKIYCTYTVTVICLQCPTTRNT